MTERQPPANIAYEASLVFLALIGDEKSVEQAAEIVEPAHFYRTNHQLIWQAAVELIKAGEPVESTTIATRLANTGKIKDQSIKSYMLKIMDEYYPPSNVEHYAWTVRQCAAMREVIERANAAAHRAYNHGGDFQAVIDFATESMSRIDLGGDQHARSVRDLMFGAMDRYGKSKEGIDTAIKTGLLELDSLLPGGGLRGSKLVIIAARPGIGKTAMMLSMARHMGKNNHRVGILSLEMDADELIDRLVAMESGINTVRLASRYLSNQDWIDITAAGSRISSFPILIDDTGGLSIHEIRRRCRKMASGGAEIIFIDQLSKITGGLGKSEYERRSDVVNQLAVLKKEIRIPVVLLAQINRMGEPEPPMLSHLKSTGSLEEDADIVLLGHRKHYYNPDPASVHHANWNLAKHRGGPTRRLDLHWEPKLTLFTNPPQEESVKA